MDWHSPDPQRVILALLRLRARDPASPDYRGPLLFNPGGPGGSGLSALLDHGAQLQTIAGTNYDLVAWDPRGIGASVPRVACWAAAQDRLAWEMQDTGVIDAHPGALYEAFARAQAFSRTCARTMGAEGMLRHVGTTVHARDLLEIVEQLGQEKLTYWGFSYGTVLGGTFAAMYPDRISRLVSDGNVDLEEWYNDKYIAFLTDADKVMDAFYELCYKAGSKCAMYANSPKAVQARLDALIEDIKTNPIIIPASDEDPVPTLVTYSSLKRLISTMLYQPVQFFAIGAQILAGLEKGDGTLYHHFLSMLTPRPASFCAAETIPPNIPITGPGADTDDAFPAIMCADRQLNDTAASLRAYAVRLQAQSRAAGAVQIVFRISCAGWEVTPAWRFGGPLGGNTSFPLLFVANAADNVTPLISARRNAARFPGSAVLVQDAYGHTSLAAPSVCTARHVRAYFHTGALPAEGTVCEADAVPFQRGGAGPEDEVAVAVRRLALETDWAGGFRRGPW